MMDVRYGEIYLINFSPSFGHEYQKLRPAIVISPNELLMRSNLVTCIAITSKSGNFLQEDDVLLRKDSKNKLAYDSVIKMHHISSFDKNRIHKYIGAADEKVLEEIKKRLKKQLDL